MWKKEKIVAFVLLMLCLIQLNVSGQTTSSKSDTLSYDDAIEGILRLDVDLKACEGELFLEKVKVDLYKNRAEKCESAGKVVRRRVFWGKVWLGLKAGGVGVLVGIAIVKI